MTAVVIQLRDYEWARPVRDSLGPAEVIVLPVIRVERLVADMLAPKPRRSLLGDL